MPGLGKRPDKRRETFRGSENVKTNGGRLSRGAGNATANDGRLSRGAGNATANDGTKKQETCFNHLIKKGIYYGKRK